MPEKEHFPNNTARNCKHFTGNISYLFANWFSLKQPGDTVSKLCRKRSVSIAIPATFCPDAALSTVRVPGHKTQLLWKTGPDGNEKLEKSRQIEIPSFVATFDQKYKFRLVIYTGEIKIKNLKTQLSATHHRLCESAK